jgi:peptide chain release factor subunit 1
MFTANDLKELVSYTSSEPVLSVYLSTDPSEGNSETFKLRLRTMLKNVNLPEDVSKVEAYFQNQHDWTGRGVAVFSCASDDYFRSYSIALPVSNLTLVSDRPAVSPLANLLDNYGGYGVVLVDKQGARLFHFNLGELREQEGTLGESVRRTKRGGASSMPGHRGGSAGRTRNMDELVERNMRDIAEFAVKFFEENHVRRVLIGGTDDNIAMLRSLLPKSWQSLIVGNFPMSMNASHTEVLAQAMEAGEEAVRKHELRFTEQMVTAAAKAGNAVVGLEDTLDAINHGRVQTLLVLENFHQSGYRCTGCDQLQLKKTDQPCQECDGRSEAVEDVVDLAISAVLRRSGDVEVLSANPQLEKAGNIGAILRY